MECRENTSLLHGQYPVSTFIQEMNLITKVNLNWLIVSLSTHSFVKQGLYGLGNAAYSINLTLYWPLLYRMMSTESANSFTLIGEASDGGTMENLSRRLKVQSAERLKVNHIILAGADWGHFCPWSLTELYFTQVTSDLFDIMSGQTDVDHPLCEECTDTLLDHLDTQLNITENECQNYKWDDCLSFLVQLNLKDRRNVVTDDCHICRDKMLWIWMYFQAVSGAAVTPARGGWDPAGRAATAQRRGGGPGPGAGGCGGAEGRRSPGTGPEQEPLPAAGHRGATVSVLAACVWKTESEILLMMYSTW